MYKFSAFPCDSENWPVSRPNLSTLSLSYKYTLAPGSTVIVWLAVRAEEGSNTYTPMIRSNPPRLTRAWKAFIVSRLPVGLKPQWAGPVGTNPSPSSHSHSERPCGRDLPASSASIERLEGQVGLSPSFPFLLRFCTRCSNEIWAQAIPSSTRDVQESRG